MAQNTADREASFHQLVHENTPRLFRLAVRMMTSIPDAEDVLQEAYIRAYQALVADHFEGNAKIETWLYRIVTNSALDALRARRRRAATPIEAIDEVPTWADAEMIRAHVAVTELASWVEDLPVDQRVAIILKELEGQSTAEIAHLLGTTEGAIEQRLVRAKASLRKKESGDG